MKILYYNWVQFDNKRNQGGGVNIYQKNLIDYLIKNTDNEVYFLSAGWDYNPLKNRIYIKKTKNIYKKKCKTFKIINSSIMAPSYAIFMNIDKYINDTESYDVFDKFIQKYGPFDVIHFNNIEGISINVLKLKEKYPNTKFIVSIHNYQPICPLVQYFQNHNNCICNNFDNGNECLKCPAGLPDNKEYSRRAKNYYYDKFRGGLFFLRPLFKTFAKIFKYKAKEYIGTQNNVKPENFVVFRKHNIEYLNKYADIILAVSNRVKDIMIAHGCEPNKVKTSYIGTKFAENELKHSIAKTSKPFTIAYLGYERIDKGFFFLMDALSKIDDKTASEINVVLAVAHIHKENVFPKLDKFNKVTIHNGYTHDKLQEILSEVNLGIVPVLWEDNLPQVAIEMTALGVPILCSSFGGASELCKNEKFKFNGGDEDDFCLKLKKFVESPKSLDEYWKYHPDLTTMEKHVDELAGYYQK